MAIKSILSPEGSIVSGIATGILVYAVYDRSLPDAATMGATPANDPNIESGRKKAVWTSAAVLAGVTLLTRDMNVFILGGAVLVALDLHARHGNAASPETGKVDLTADVGAFAGSQSQGYGSASGQGKLSVVS